MTRTPDPDPILVAEWPLNNRGEQVRVSIENYKGSWLISVRKWFKIDDGQMRPGKGLAMSAKNLPRLATAIEHSLATARDRGLIPADEEGGQ
jgi:hypothetical protein